MTNDKSNKELDKSTLRIPTFNMILRQILVVNAYGDKSLSDEILLQDELFYNTVSQLNFSKDSSEVRQLLSYLLELTGEPDSYLVEEILLDFVIGKGCTECSRTVCENIFGKQPTFADMMRHPWFEHLMNHPAQTEPYNPLSPFVRNDAFYWAISIFLCSTIFRKVTVWLWKCWSILRLKATFLPWNVCHFTTSINVNFPRRFFYLKLCMRKCRQPNGMIGRLSKKSLTNSLIYIPMD